MLLYFKLSLRMECYHLSVLWSIWISLSLIVNAQQEFDIRLSGGDNPREGRVEVFSEGIWGSICDIKQWSITDAYTVCKLLSYAFSAPRNAACCTRVTEMYPCLHSEDASVICRDSGQPRDNDVRIVGGSHQVEIFLNTQWGTLCSYPWYIVKADAVCRQSGYGGADLLAEGLLPEPSLQPSYTGCSKGNASMRGYGHLFGCRNDLVLKQDVRCDNPNILVCTRHQAELPVRLFGGSSKISSNKISGRVEVLYGGFWWGICSKKWDLTDANVVCNQLGYNAALSNSATVTYPDGHYIRYYLMFRVNCTGEEMNIGRCARVYGSPVCIGGDYSSVTCEMVIDSNDGILTNKHAMIAICLVLIPTMLLLLFVIAYCVYKKHSREEGHSDTGPGQSSYSPMNQQECIELSHEATDEQNNRIKV